MAACGEAAASMTRPRNDEHPVWCTREEPTNTGLLRHRSKRIRVGARRRIGDRGEVTVCLASTGNGPTWVTVNASHMIGVTAELDVAAGTALVRGLAELLDQAGSPQ